MTLLKNLNAYMDPVESFDTLMQEFYQNCTGQEVREFKPLSLCLEWALKVVKQQHPHVYD